MPRKTSKKKNLCPRCHHKVNKCPKHCTCSSGCHCNKKSMRSYKYRKCPYCGHTINKCPKSCRCSNKCHFFSNQSRKNKKSRKSKKRGGNFYKPAPPMPGPFVGQPIGSQPSTWPGENGMGADRNYYSENLYKVDPQTMMKLGGKKSKKRSKKGGLGPFSQGIVNMGRSLGYNWGSASNEIRGYDAPINPLPWKDQLTLNKSIY